MLESFIDWFMGLGAQYGVNPIIFGSIYVGAIPFFTLSIGWLVRNIRKKKSIVLPTLFSGFFFISAYLYLLIAGENIPFWVYGVVVALILFGAYSTVQKVRSQTTTDSSETKSNPGASHQNPNHKLQTPN